MKKILLFLVLFFGAWPVLKDGSVCLLGINTATAQIFGDNEYYEGDLNIPTDVFADILEGFSQMGMGVQFDGTSRVVVSEYVSGLGRFEGEYVNNNNGTWSLSSMSWPPSYSPPQMQSGGTIAAGATGDDYASGYGGAGVSDWDEYYWWPSLVSTGTTNSGDPIYYASDNPWLNQASQVIFPTPTNSSSGGGSTGGGGPNALGHTSSGKPSAIYETYWNSNLQGYDPYDQTFYMQTAKEDQESAQLTGAGTAFQNSYVYMMDIFNCFVGNPSFIEDLQKGNFDNYNSYVGLPLAPADRSSALMERIAYEAFNLTDAHPDWSDTWAYTTAFWNVVSGTATQQNPRMPSAADMVKIHDIISSYGSVLGVIPGSGYMINKSVTSTGSNFHYNAFWRLAHNIKPNHYKGGLGVVGEGLALYKEYSALNINIRNNNSGSIQPAAHYSTQSGTQDFTLLFTQNTGSVVISQLANAADGSPQSRYIALAEGERLKLLYEVKTYSATPDAKTIQKGIINGFYQAIKNAVANPQSGDTRVVSILYVSRDAYLKAESATPGIFSALHTQLTSYGGALMLKEDLFEDAKVALDSILADIKNQTQN